MQKLPYHYKATLYTNWGNFVQIGHVYSDLDLKGILREGMYLEGDPDIHINHLRRVK